jgi:hypothetical protein
MMQTRQIAEVVYNPATNHVLELSNIIYERHADGRPPERAYMVGQKLRDCIFGMVKACEILKFRNSPDAPWETTGTLAAVKIMPWRQRIEENRHVQDPRQEVAAMHFVSRDRVHPHVTLGPIDVLQNQECLLMFMPFCSSVCLLVNVYKKWVDSQN